ncbi:MAG TPA: DUF885 domain-containing protein [Gemmatimonadales bacterium]|jgi:uncharacterized protein (DUF885 family)|nr:DUF885 domain-containing protein [Gemmatimonadales bacterium]
MLLRAFAAAVLPLALAAPIRQDPGRDLVAIADEYLQARLAAFPEFATQLGLPGAKHDRVRDRSPAGERAWWKQEDALLARLKAIDAGALRRTDRVTHGILLEELESSVRLRVCNNRLWTVSPLTGWQAFYAGIAQQQPVGTPPLRQQALTRWNALPRVVDAEIANLKEGIEKGYTAPAVNVERVLAGLDKILEASPTASPFYSPATRDSTPAFRAAMERLASGPIAAALRRYRDYLRNDYLPKARTDVSVTALPQGAACYRAAIRRFTTLDLEGDELYEMGVRELAAAESSASDLSRRGFGDPDYRAVLSAMNQDPKYTIPSRNAVIPETDSIIARAWAVAPKWFGILPKAPVKVEPFPEFEEQSVPAGQYLRAALDGSRPGIYRINLYLFTKPGGRLEADRIAFHEAIPGHHFQLAIGQERTGLHPIARYLFNSAFAEGWGIYSERVADEMGLYRSDAERLKDLEAMIYSFATLVMETGMHTRGWTREQAIAFETGHTSRSEEQAALDVDRRIGWPGQGLSYPVGYLEIRRLRDLAEKRLGDRFDIRAFHDRVLEDGSVPLGLLRAKIEAWLDQAPAS